MSDDTSFASRWSRRKQAVKDDAVEEESLQEQPEETVEEAEPEPEKTEAEVLAEFNLKDPDEMEPGDDFSGFMNSGIPQALRNRALRKLWLSNPALANLDQLLDYGEDFTSKGDIVETITTAYKVGRGFVDKLTEEDESEVESTDLAKIEGSPETEETPEIKPIAPKSNVRKPESIRAHAPRPAESNLAVTSENSPKQTPNRRKRMNFEF